MFALARSIKNNVVVPLLSAVLGVFLLASVMAFSVVQALNEQSSSSKQLTNHTRPTSSHKHTYTAPRSTRLPPRSDKSQAINDWFFSSSSAPKRSSATSTSKKTSRTGSTSTRCKEEVRGRDAHRPVVRSTSQDSITSVSTLASAGADSEEEETRPVRHRRLTMRGGKAVMVDIY